MNAAERQAALDRLRQRQADGLADLDQRGELGGLLESFRPYIRVIARALSRERLQARIDESDLIQDALLEAHRAFNRFRGVTVAELIAWLRQVVVRAIGHTLRGHLEAGRRAVEREQGGDALAGLAADNVPSPSDAAIRQEQAIRIADALTHLPDDMQRVLLGRHMEGLSYAALAEQLGRSEGAVRVLYTRGLRRLREECGENP